MESSFMAILGIGVIVAAIVISLLCGCVRALQHSDTTAPPFTATFPITETPPYRITQQYIHSISNSNRQQPSSQASYPVPLHGNRSVNLAGLLNLNHQAPSNSRLDEPPPSYYEVVAESSNQTIPRGLLSSDPSLTRNGNPS